MFGFTVVWLINSGNLLTNEAPEPGFYAAFKLGCGIMLPFAVSCQFNISDSFTKFFCCYLFFK